VAGDGSRQHRFPPRARPPRRFYIHRFDHKGELFDARADLYDQAFMLLALAYAGRALGRPELFAAAEDLGDALNKSWHLLKAGLARYRRRTGEDEERAEAAAAYAGLLKYFETTAGAPGATSSRPTRTPRRRRSVTGVLKPAVA